MMTGRSISASARLFNTIGWFLAYLVITVSASGCSFYHHSFPPQPTHEKSYDLHVVQVDDFGSLWHVDAAQETLAAVDDSRRKTNTLVVVFIHGWHHNAQADDPNLLDFKDALTKLSDLLDGPERRERRQHLTGDPTVRVVGIYIGWRGRSLPGLLDYVTLWWRKAAAERVGSGDVSEFLERLQRIYLRANAVSPANPDAIHKRMGLVTLGHSFGGQVLLQSVARYLEYELALRAPCVADGVAPPGNVVRARVEVAIDGFGDLNILLNPATEAYQFGRIDALYRQLEYPLQQTPQLVVFSADNDSARQFLFPASRWVARPFRPGFRTAYQDSLWGAALGELKSQHTHTLIVAKSEADSLRESDYGEEGGRKIAGHDFTATTVFNGIKMSPLPANPVGGPRIPNSPVAVVSTHEKIIDGHNGIFKPDFRNFLASYIAFVEGKRLIVKQQRRDELAKVADRIVPHPEGCK
jgi:hypothetical protein